MYNVYVSHVIVVLYYIDMKRTQIIKIFDSKYFSCWQQLSILKTERTDKLWFYKYFASQSPSSESPQCETIS